ncbi:MAG: SPOR domain-containing protein [Cellulophaga sp.]
MKTAHYIKELLYRYNCIILPEFGAFLTQTKSAVIHEITNAFYPPTKIISFNEQLSSNDGLLVSYMATAEKTSYDAMLERLKEVTAEWKKQLENGERISLSDIGELWLNNEGKIQFQPVYHINYLSTSFGLPSFVSAPITREILKEEVVEMEEKIPFIITPETREKTAFKPYLKYAAIILLAVSTGITGFRFFNENLNKQQLALEDAQTEVSKNIQEATFFSSVPLELPAFNLEITKKVKKAEKTHHIIAGAFRIQANANKKVRLLKRKGYNATYIGVNKHGFHQVTYDSFTDKEVAITYLRKIKHTVSKDAWMSSVRN